MVLFHIMGLWCLWIQTNLIHLATAIAFCHCVEKRKMLIDIYLPSRNLHDFAITATAAHKRVVQWNACCILQNVFSITFCLIKPKCMCWILNIVSVVTSFLHPSLGFMTIESVSLLIQAAGIVANDVGTKREVGTLLNDYFGHRQDCFWLVLFVVLTFFHISLQFSLPWKILLLSSRPHEDNDNYLIIYSTLALEEEGGGMMTKVEKEGTTRVCLLQLPSGVEQQQNTKINTTINLVLIETKSVHFRRQNNNYGKWD